MSPNVGCLVLLIWEPRIGRRFSPQLPLIAFFFFLEEEKQKATVASRHTSLMIGGKRPIKVEESHRSLGFGFAPTPSVTATPQWLRRSTDSWQWYSH